jgi:ribonuclease HII
VRDSKQLTADAREELSGHIWQHAVTAGVAFVPVETIDRIGIAEASRQAWLGAIAELAIKPAHLLLDAFRLPACRLPQTAVIDGDEKIMSIACASIIAKVARDRVMQRNADDYPGYGFYTNKGYATREHFAALDRLGPCGLHRRSFSPVREMVALKLPL